MSLYKRGDLWWLYLVHGGRRFRRSTGEREKKRAEREPQRTNIAALPAQGKKARR